MLEWWEFALRLGCAFGLGCLVGVERQWRARMAGLRTNALVSVGSALFVLLAANTVDEVSPTRVAAQVVSGIGFLGAGVILRDGINVRGINTAATIWCASAVGVLAGSGIYVGAAMGAVTVVAANVLLRPVARRLQKHNSASHEVGTVYRIHVVCSDSQDAHVRALLLQALSDTDFSLRSVESGHLTEDPDSVSVRADIVVSGRQDDTLEQVVRRLSLEPEVSSVHWREMEEEAS
ncbi:MULTISPECIES: MgtC/SapB family protein [unclassified Nocardiopsis]|uniref:MgtC/SapB family protein n=1 Tax=unclassified Nocardiopsis TaxID=2649073 RepID=UPI0013587FF4|nr:MULTISPECIES: MgtC/SapB family protein [unclassified Nocardiopsis]